MVQEVRPTDPSMGQLRERRAWVAWAASLEVQEVPHPAWAAWAAFPEEQEVRRPASEASEASRVVLEGRRASEASAAFPGVLEERRA